MEFDFMYASIAIFGITAGFGLYLLSFVLRNKETSKPVAIAHGFFAFLGFIILVLFCYLEPPGPLASLIVFILAATIGGVVFYKDVTGTLPKRLAIVHGTVAVIGFILLILIAFL